MRWRRVAVALVLVPWWILAAMTMHIPGAEATASPPQDPLLMTIISGEISLVRNELLGEMEILKSGLEYDIERVHRELQSEIDSLERKIDSLIDALEDAGVIEGGSIRAAEVAVLAERLRSEAATFRDTPSRALAPSTSAGAITFAESETSHQLTLSDRTFRWGASSVNEPFTWSVKVSNWSGQDLRVRVRIHLLDARGGIVRVGVTTVRLGPYEQKVVSQTEPFAKGTRAATRFLRYCADQIS